MLTDAQKQAIVSQDRSIKNQYLSAVPKISNTGVKAHDKFKAYEASIGASHWEQKTGQYHYSTKRQKVRKL